MIPINSEDTIARTYSSTRTQPPHRSHASAPTSLRTYDTTRTQPPAPTHPRHHTNVPAPTPLRICDTTRTRPPATLAHLRLRRYAPATPLAHNLPATLAHLRLRRCAQATPLSRICAYAAAHKRHYSRASASPHSRTHDATLTHLRHQSHAPTPTPLRTCIPLSRASIVTYTHLHRDFALPSYCPRGFFFYRSLSELIGINQSLSDILR